MLIIFSVKKEKESDNKVDEKMEAIEPKNEIKNNEVNQLDNQTMLFNF